MRPYGILCILLALTFVCTIPASADNLYASIRGTVADPTGAVVAGVKLTATNTATGITYTTTTNKDGVFTFLQLQIGNYTVRAEQTGFKAYQASGIHLELNQVFNLEVKLAMGTVSEQVVVEANPVQVEQTDMQLGTTITGNQISDIPLNGRNWTQLQQLQPGIVGTSDRFGGNNGGFSGNGSGTQQNSFLINGVDSNDAALNTVLIVPSPDAIGEFRLVTSTLNPEYGRNSGTIINAAIKSGTNQFHGNAFEFYRDTFLDATAWFKKGPSPFHQHQFGGTLGGPIYKDHAFFFFSYQGLRATNPQTSSTPTVFSAAQRGGDFSANDAGAFSTNQIPVAMFGDASSTCPVSGGVQCDPTNPASTYANLFSTGVIPTEDLNPLALKLMNQFVPLPNAAGNAFQFNPITTQTSSQYVYRIDDKLTNNDSLWFYGLYQTNPSQDTLPFTGATLPGFSEEAKRHQQQYSVSWTHT
ncbi:MAG: carboxypeptidase-like regulatory domain-containing protein [Terriglobales bacterium]